MSGQLRSVSLRAAFDRGEADRVLAIFRTFISETGWGQGQQQSRPPSRARQEPSTINAADIDKFYERVRTGYFDGSEKLRAEKDRQEAEIIRAGREGRVVR